MNKIFVGLLGATLFFAACGGVVGASDADSVTPAPSENNTPTNSPAHSSSGSSEAENVCTGVAQTAQCEAPLDVTTAGEIFDVVAALKESVAGSTRKDAGALLRPTRDIRVTIALELDVNVYRAAHPACDPNHGSGSGAPGDYDPPNGPTACVETAFAPEVTSARFLDVPQEDGDRPLPDGVTCTASQEGRCMKVAIAAGTVVRFQRSMTPHYYPTSFPHWIRIIRACTVPCDASAGELLCGASTTCIDDASFCLLCEGKSKFVCACRDACVSKSNNASCTYQLTDDASATGTCSAGTCKLK